MRKLKGKMMIRYDEEKEKIKVYSFYDEELLQIFRSLSDRLWNRAEGCWEIGCYSFLNEFFPAIKGKYEYIISHNFPWKKIESKQYTAYLKDGLIYLNFKPKKEEEIERELTYQLANSFWIEKHTGWDGKVCLYNRKYRCFPFGFIDRVEEIEGKKIKVNYAGKMKYIIVPNKSVFEILNMEEREYQRRVIEKAIERERGIINIATGGGKTLIGCELIRRFGVRSIVIVPTKVLLNQWHRILSKIFGESMIGIIGEGKKDVKDITVCMIHSAKKEMVNDFNLVIFDEVHRLGAKIWSKVSRMINAKYRFGLSATALLREDGTNLEIIGICGDIIDNIKANELQEKGYLSKCRVIFHEISGVKFFSSYHKAYESYIVLNEERNKKIAEEAKRYIEEDRKVLILVDRITHGMILSNMIGIPFVSGKTKGEEREKKIDEFNKGSISGMIATKIFELGLDIPSIEVIIIAAPCKSIIKTIQRVGRGMRKHKRKKELVVVDFIDKAKYFYEQSMRRKKIYEGEGFDIESDKAYI